MDKRAKKIGLESPSQLICIEFDTGKARILGFAKRQVQSIQDGPNQALLMDAEEGDSDRIPSDANDSGSELDDEDMLCDSESDGSVYSLPDLPES